MTEYRFEYVSRTDTGRVRQLNEDSIAVEPERGVVIVADGMGGYHGGEIASHLAVETIQQHLSRSLHDGLDLDTCLDEAERVVEEANRAIWQTTDKSPELRGMGTTVVVGLFRQNVLAYSWVGDSRLYRMRNGRLRQLNSDHTLVQELVNQGLFASVAEAVEAGVGDNVLTRALGADEPVLVDTGNTDIVPGDLYLFCTDGLNHMIADSDIESALSDESRDLGGKADRLVELACNAGGADNITLALIGVSP